MFTTGIYAAYVYHMYIYIYASDDCNNNTHIYANATYVYHVHIYSIL